MKKFSEVLVMRIFSTGLIVRLLVVLLSWTVAQSSVGKTSPDIAFTDVNVIDVRNGLVVEKQTVVIEAGRITKVGSKDSIAIPEGALVIDGAEKYLFPGLMDMHVHLLTPDDLILLLANGVTTVRNMQGEPSTLRMREAVELGQLPGPRIVTAGRVIDGMPPTASAFQGVTDPAAARDIVARQAQEGYDFIKIYSGISLEVFNAVMQEARQHNMEVVGHLPRDVPMMTALKAGLKSTEHLLGLIDAAAADESVPNMDLSFLDPLAREFVTELGRGEHDLHALVDDQEILEVATVSKEEGAWFTPTLYAMSNMTSNPAPPNPMWDKYMSIAMQDLWDFASGPAYAMSEDQMRGEDAVYELRSLLMRKLLGAGANLLVGTDSPVTHVPFGFAMVEELRAMVKAGVPQDESLRAATLNPARYFGREGELGEIKTGALADLILLEDNPLEDVGALREIAGVMSQGQWRARDELQGMLDDIVKKNKSIELVFSDAPEFPDPGAALADFLAEDGSATRVIADHSDDDKTTIRAAFGESDAWKSVTIDVGEEKHLLQSEGGTTVSLIYQNGQWTLTSDGSVIESVKGEPIASVLTGTPADAAILRAVVGDLEPGEERNAFVWNCGPSLDCSSALSEIIRIRAVKREVIPGYGFFLEADVYEVAAVQRGNITPFSFWIAQGFAKGQPVRYEVDGEKPWRRIR